MILDSDDTIKKKANIDIERRQLMSRILEAANKIHEKQKHVGTNAIFISTQALKYFRK